jgi:hypothetical protein
MRKTAHSRAATGEAKREYATVGLPESAAPQQVFSPIPIPGRAVPETPRGPLGPAPQDCVVRRRVFIATRPSHNIEITTIPKDLREEQKSRLRRLIDDQHCDYYFKSDKDLSSYLMTRTPQPKAVIRQRPDLSPAHIPAPSGAGDTRYRLNSGFPPASYQFPQSPTHTGDARAPITTPLDFTAAHGAMTHFKAQDGNQLSKRKTLNTFSYDLEAHVRLTRIEQVDPDAWGFDPDSTHQTASVQSEVYQSDGKIVPASRNALGTSRLADKATANASIRHAIKLSYETASQFDQFADTSVLAFNRNGTVDYQNVEQQRGAGRNKAYIIEDKSLGCAMFHSETQALGMAARELPTTMKALVDGIVQACRTIGAPIQAVIVGLKVVGVSHPNAVCRGACKPALVTLLDLINQQLVDEYHPRKEALRAQQIYLRRSEQYRATMDVQGLQLFLGSETGGVREAAPVVPGHGQVTEHPPRQ